MNFDKKSTLLPSLIFLTLATYFIPAAGRALYERDDFIHTSGKTVSDAPYAHSAIHNVGKIGMTVTNQGTFGTGFIGDQIDTSTGLPAPSGVYPYPGNLQYHYSGAFWIGAVIGRDTLVSVGADGWLPTMEMWPDPHPIGEIAYHSISDPNDAEAVSEQDFIAVYTDTVTDPTYVEMDEVDGRPHIPLNIEVTERSYAWSYSYAEDFILFDYSIRNIGRRELTRVYMGIYVDADVQYVSATDGFDDDICGFKRTIPSPGGCGFIDTVNIAWIADNNGLGNDDAPCPSGFDLTSLTGVRVVRTPSDDLKYSFNWWVSNRDCPLDWGPRMIGTPDDPFRPFNGCLGTPMGDKNKYYIMRHEEFDYDQVLCALDHTADGWLPPPAGAGDIADGFDTRYLLSFGPFDIYPGEVLPITFAYVAGEYFHTDCNAFQRLFDMYDPYPYYEQLSFDDLGLNAIWASWIYDNPGVDTDDDGFNFGKFRLCVHESTVTFDTIATEPDTIIDTIVTYTVVDTLWYEGDGIPDFRGASPPPAPILRVTPRINEFHQGELYVRWNGLRSETEKDIFSNMVDFEGYRVFISLSPQFADFVLVSSYDKEDYNKYIWNNSRRLWELCDPPFNLESLQRLYDGIGDQPDYFDRDNPYYWYDSAFYFTRQDWNRSELKDTARIHKIYPDQPPPTTIDPDSAAIYYPDELTQEGYFKYYEYAHTLRNLLPSQLYYVSVTAFDFGSPKSGLPSLETSPTINAVAEYAQNQTGEVEAEGLNVVVYPNPYRIDGNYRSQSGGGFEGRGMQSSTDDRVRAIHFTNLPHKCTIRIFTIDGDLVRVIDHNFPPHDPRSMHDKWDVITRNTQAPVSGIYYYAVESEYGNQIGKIVIIM